MPVKLVTILKV